MKILSVKKMEMFKVKVLLNIDKNQDGISLKKLANITEEVNKFFYNLGEDCTIEENKNIWLAKNF